MPAFLKNRDWKGQLGLAGQTISLLATAWVMMRTWYGPRSQSFGQVLTTALFFTLFAWLWSAVIALLLNLAIRKVERVDVVGATLRTSSVAVWFAPATMLLTSFSIWAIPAALVLVVNATRLLYGQWQLTYTHDVLAPVLVPREAGLLGAGQVSGTVLPRHLGPAMAVSFGVQSGLAAGMLRHPVLSAALLTMSVAILTVFAISGGLWAQKREPSLPRSIFALLLTLILATGMSVVGTGGSGWGIGTGNGSGPGSIADLFRKLGSGNASKSLPNAAPGKKMADRPVDVAGYRVLPEFRRPEGNLGGSFPGVVLWPEVKPMTLVVPVLSSTGREGAMPSRPFSIPFGGEYWMYRWLMYKRPPANSYFQRGTPARLSFSTTDRWPLQMEAHQRLEQSIETSCCGRIRVEIRNADKYPGTVSLELVLINNQFSTTATESLGYQPVVSQPAKEGDETVPAAETLEFGVPEDGALLKFNEFEVVFHRSKARQDKSARVAIERFVLIPRG